jgi:hypothetical protein
MSINENGITCIILGRNLTKWKREQGKKSKAQCWLKIEKRGGDELLLGDVRDVGFVEPPLPPDFLVSFGLGNNLLAIKVVRARGEVARVKVDFDMR